MVNKVNVNKVTVNRVTVNTGMSDTWSLKGQLLGTPGSLLDLWNLPGFFFFSLLSFLAWSFTFFSTFTRSLVDCLFDCFLLPLPPFVILPL